jgi:thymidylate kinase
MKGNLIVFEGPDGAGKSTFAREAGRQLVDLGFRVKMFERRSHNPTRNKIEWLQMTGDNWREINGHLERYDFVIADRYCVSSYVYQHFLGEHTVAEVCQALGELPLPHVTFVLLPSEKVIKDRVASRGDGDDPNLSGRKIEAYGNFCDSDIPYKGKVIVVEGEGELVDINSEYNFLSGSGMGAILNASTSS